MRSLLPWTVIALALVGCDDEFVDETPPLDEIVASFRADLEERGFEVATGDRELFTIEDCAYVLETLGNCLANNPTAPYVIPTVPLWPDELVDEAMRDVFGPMPGDTWATHRIGGRDAVVVLAHLPPAAAYFGMHTYVFSRKGQIDTDDAIYRSVDDPFMKSILFATSPNPERVLTFSSVGDGINDVTIEQRSGSVWNRDRYLVSTPDEQLAQEIGDALLRAGVPEPDDVFVEPLSPDLIRTGLGEDADDLTALIRYALPEDEVAGDTWRDQLPFTVLRVRDPDFVDAVAPYPQPVLTPRTARSELHLDGDVRDLVDEVKQRWGQPDAPDADFESLLLTVDLRGDHCLERPMNCLGDNGDADYQISPTENLDDGQVLAVVGTLATETGNATYTSLAVNWIPPLIGLENLSQLDLVGSADVFADDVANTDQLYVQYFARDCTGIDDCFTVTEDAIPLGDDLKLIQRNYVEPGSTVGPDPNLLVNPVLIVLDGDERPAE